MEGRTSSLRAEDRSGSSGSSSSSSGGNHHDVARNYARIYNLRTVEDVIGLAERNDDFRRKVINSPHHNIQLASIIGFPAGFMLEQLRYFQRNISPADRLRAAARIGDLPVLRATIREAGREALNIDEALALAIEGRKMAVIDELLSVGVRDPNWLMVEAAKTGSIEIMKKLIKAGGSYHDLALGMAASKGHYELAQFLLNEGATDYEFALKAAERNGHEDVADLIHVYMTTQK
jgi:hypothetical protein